MDRPEKLNFFPVSFYFSSLSNAVGSVFLNQNWSVKVII
jgi:hypothetical protein